jgi:hypothetical protein
MSINNTNVDEIYNNCKDLILDLDNYFQKHKNLSNIDTNELKNKYSHLSDTSPTLFSYILREFVKTRNNSDEESKFLDTLNNVLRNLKQIQTGELTQLDASGKIGTFFANNYIKNFDKMR